MTRRHPAVEEVAARLGPFARRDEPLAPYCTYRVGGPAALFADVGSIRELDCVASALGGSDLPLLVVGRGSNLLVAERGFDGLALHLVGDFTAIELGGNGVVAGGAASLPVVARRSAAAGLTGFEWAVGVPGSVGGAVRMNAGGHGSDMSASLIESRVYDLRSAVVEDWPVGRLRLGYRRSALAAHHLVVSARLALSAGDVETSERKIAEIVAWRRAHQPGGQNAGSVFANPDGDSAGRLIETAGLKGHRVGTAEVSSRHANFIQADPGGSADDIAALMRALQRAVLERHGVLLRPENHLVGFPDELLPLPSGAS